jgi:hypothetical protein
LRLNEKIKTWVRLETSESIEKGLFGGISETERERWREGGRERNREREKRDEQIVCVVCEREWEKDG